MEIGYWFWKIRITKSICETQHCISALKHYRIIEPKRDDADTDRKRIFPFHYKSLLPARIKTILFCQQHHIQNSLDAHVWTFTRPVNQACA